MIVVLDTQAFRGDVYARRKYLGEVLRRARKGDYELVVPSVVIAELARQFPQRLTKAKSEIKKALRQHYGVLDALEVPFPNEIEVDVDQLTADYEKALRARLEQAHCDIADPPEDLERALEWAVARRRPFDQEGKGFPDAAIWLTVLSLAERDTVILVTEDTDLADDDDPALPGEELRKDLQAQGLAPDHVRLVRRPAELLELLVAAEGEALARAEALLQDSSARVELIRAVEKALEYREVAPEEVSLGFQLEDDTARVAMYDIRDDIDALAARELGEGSLLIDLRMEADVVIELAIFKGDAYILGDDSPVSIMGDRNDHYFEADAEIALELSVEAFYSEGDGTFDVEIEALTQISPTVPSG